MVMEWKQNNVVTLCYEVDFHMSSRAVSATLRVKKDEQRPKQLFCYSKSPGL